MAGIATASLAESAMEIPAGTIGSIAWLVLQEQASGSSDAVVAKSLRVSESDISALIESVTGLQGADAISLWERGVVAIVAANRANVQTIESGWDGAEAQALEKLNSRLAEMKTNGDPETMLKIAMGANRAIRRNERQGGYTKQGGVDDGKPTLATGQLGNVQLSLSVAVQNQLTSSPNHIKPQPVMEDLEMLDLQQTRELVIEAGIKKDTPNFQELMEGE